MLVCNSLIRYSKRWHWSRIPFSCSTLFDNVHTWAISFLRHLANMSSMVSLWASTDSVFVPNWGLCPKPRRLEEVVYIPNDSCSHFTQRLFLRNFLSNIHVLLITIHSHHSYLLYITFIRATITFIYMTYSCFHFPRLPWQAGCPRSFVSDTRTHLNSWLTTWSIFNFVFKFTRYLNFHAFHMLFTCYNIIPCIIHIQYAKFHSAYYQLLDNVFPCIMRKR
jgi:hypothetical protein